MEGLNKIESEEDRLKRVNKELEIKKDPATHIYRAKCPYCGNYNEVPSGSDKFIVCRWCVYDYRVRNY